MTETSQPTATEGKSTAPDAVHTLARFTAFVFVVTDVFALSVLGVEILYPLAVAFPNVELTALAGTGFVVVVLGVFQFVLAAVVLALLEL